jgi:LPXTG-site transpeptidase (sortase) family protein
VKPSADPSSNAAPTVISRAREGRPAASTRVRFRPEELILSAGGRAEVQPAATVDGELQVPQNVRHLGWWDGGAFAGDPFGSTVIAGHVDSRTQGLGFFARLLRADVGEKITLRGDGQQAVYQITSVKTVTKEVLAEDGQAFEQTGKHRLVLITCTGNYRADRGGYDSNLVIYAKPVGAAR